MSDRGHKYTLDEIEAMEIAPGAAREKLEGWIPGLTTEGELLDALEKAFSYRGDVTLTLKDGVRVQAYIFNRSQGRTLESSAVEFFSPGSNEKQRLAYSQILGIDFSGKDCAAGKQWEDWMQKYRKRKAAGEKGIALLPESLEE